MPLHGMAILFVAKKASVLARMGILDPVLVMLKGALWLAEACLVGAGLYGLMLLVSSARYGTAESDRRNSVLLVAGIGSITAVVIAWWACGGPFLLPGVGGMRQAALYILFTVAAGGAAAWMSWMGLEVKPAGGPEQMVLTVAAGWVLVPCVMMLAMGHSLWALPMGLVAVLPAVIGLRRLLDMPANTDAGNEENTVEPALPAELASLYGTPLGPSWWRGAAMVAVCAQATVVLAIAKWTVGASIVLMLAAAVVLWRWSAALRPRASLRDKRPWMRTAMWATVSFAAMLLTQWLAPRLGVTDSGTKPPVEEASGRKIYFSVVLLQPPMKKKEEIQLPQAKRPSFRGVMGEPVVIPFDGPYWYFQPPLMQPDDMAHVAHGRATEVNVHSTYDDALLMEAHQTLVQAVDLSCCREIDVSVTNADTRPGPIMVALILRDSTAPAPGKRVILPPQTLTSSEVIPAPVGRGPVDEVLRYPLDTVARAQGLEHFDDITVVFLPQGLRLASGTKVDVRSFTLVP